MEDIIIAILKGIATFFYNPVLYLLLIGLFIFGWQRVRRERRSFGIKVFGMFNNIFASVAPSLITGLLGSAVLIALGAALPAGVVVLLSCCYLLIMLTTQLRFLSPAISGGLALIAAYFLPAFQTPYVFLNRWIGEIRHVSFLSFGVFVTVCLFIECLLVYRWGSRQTSPRMINSPRGKKIGAHEASKLWIVPLFFLVPALGPIGHGAYWPLIPGAGSHFGFAMFPLGVGLQQLITHRLPKEAVRATGHWHLATALIMALAVGLDYWLRLPVLVAAGGAAVIISRLALVFFHHRLHETRAFYFTEPGDGLRVIGVIPHSLSDRMGVVAGEVIYRVNGLSVSNEYDFYEALQANAPYCKLEVIDAHGELRFAKGAIHENDSHKIGLLFLEPNKWKRYKQTTS